MSKSKTEEKAAGKSIKSIINSMNRGKEDAEKIKTADKADLNIKRLSTGSYYIDNKLGGGIGYGVMLMYTGWEGSGKSSMALIAAREAQKDNPNKFVVIMDGERSITDSHLTRFGLDKSRTIVRQHSVLEEMLNEAQAFSTADDVCAIVIDSIKSFYSTVIEQKGAEEFSMGVEAKKLGTKMPIISSNCGDRNIALLIINQWRENTGGYGDPKFLPGGNWNKYLPFVHLDFTKRELITDKKGNIIGHVLNVRVKKSKFSAHNPKDVLEVNFYYNGGFDNKEAVVNMVFDRGDFFFKSGSWISFPNKDGEEIKLQGIDKVIDYYKENEKELKYLQSVLEKG